MKKLKRILGVLLLALVVGFVGGRVAVGAMWKSALEKYGSSLTEVPVTAERVWLSPLAGKITIEALTVGNPSGFKTEHAIRADRVEVTLKWRSFMGAKTIIRELEVVGANVTYERALLKSNLGVISDTVKEKVDSNEQVMSKLKRRVQADRVLVDGGRVNLSATLLGGRGLGMGLPQVELRDLGQNEEGITVAELTSEILKALLERAVGLNSDGADSP